MLRLPFSSLPLFSFFLPLFHPLIHTYTQTRVHTHIHTHTSTSHTTQQSFRLSQTHIHTFASLIIPLRAKRPLDPERYAHPLAPRFQGVSHPLENSSTPRHDFSWLCYSLLRTMLLGGRKAKRTELSAVPSILGYTDFPLPLFFRSSTGNQGNFGTLRPYNLNQFLFNGT